MLYKMTMERTLRVGIEFEAENDSTAEVKAEELFSTAISNPTQFDGGDTEHDYALCDGVGNELIPWM